MPMPREAAHSAAALMDWILGLIIGRKKRPALLPSARLASCNGKTDRENPVPAGLFSAFHPGNPGSQLSSSSFTLAKTIRPAAV